MSQLACRLPSIAFTFALFLLAATAPSAWADSPSPFPGPNGCVAGANFYHAEDTLPGHPQVAFESIGIPGGNAPGTPAVLNKGIYLRARSVSCSPFFPPRLDALVIAMPGFAGSATQWGEFAAQLVEKGQQSDCHGRPCNVEVWVVDRRGNGLEETQGERLARISENPFDALNYYFGAAILDQELIPAGTGNFALPYDTIKPAGLFPAHEPADSLLNGPGAVFHPLVQADVPYEADWGFEVAAEDLDALLALAKRQGNADNIFLAGHSQAGGFISNYVGRTRPDGTLGQDSFAGLVFLDAITSTGAPNPPSAANISAYLAQVDSLRSGASPVFGTQLGPIFLGPGAGAITSVAGIFTSSTPTAETIIPPGSFPSVAAGIPFLLGHFIEKTDATPGFGAPGIRMTFRSALAFDIDADPLPGAFLQSFILDALGPRIGQLELSLPLADPAACAAPGPFGLKAPCPPSPSLIDPNHVYDWVDGGSPTLLAGPLSGWTSISGFFTPALINPNAYPSKVQSTINHYGFSPARTNILPFGMTFASTGFHLIDAGELNGLQWYQPARYDADIGFITSYATIQFSQDSVTYNIDKTHISAPCFFDHRGPSYPANPFPGVTDYTEISGTGATQSPTAAALSPIPATLNAAAYGHSDMIQADDSNAGNVAPGVPGASVVTDPLIGWLLARATGTTKLPNDPQLHVFSAR